MISGGSHEIRLTGWRRTVHRLVRVPAVADVRAVALETGITPLGSRVSMTFRRRADVRLLAAVLVLSVATLGGCFSDDPPSERGDPGVKRQESAALDFDGIDGLAIGGTTADAEDGGLSLVQDGDRFDSCIVMTVESLPGIRAIVVNDTIRVIELAGENKTIAGVGPGSTKAEVTSAHAGQPVQERVNRFAFAEIAVAQSAEDDPLTLSYIDHRAERVTGVRAGHASDVVGYDEGCA